MLDNRDLIRCDTYKKVYADLLFRWRLLYQRVEVLKHLHILPEPHKGVGKYLCSFQRYFINYCYFLFFVLIKHLSKTNMNTICLKNLTINDCLQHYI